MPDTPVLFIIFNRPNTTKKVFECIRMAQPSKLFIAADAARESHPTDKERCDAARAIVQKIDWPCEVRTLFREKNLGCGEAVSEAINWFFSENEEGIILEDDCLPHPDFFVFANQMLQHYRNDKRIISINGSNLGYKLADGNSYTYSRFMNMWGWATWKDRALSIDYSMRRWKKQKKQGWWLFRKLRQYFFDTDINWYRLWQNKFNKVAEDKGFTWDWQWMFHQMDKNQLSIVPAVNLVSNIGFDADGTHTHEAENPAANIPTYALEQPLKHPSSIKPDFIYEEEYVKGVWCYHKRLPAIFYLKQFISTYLLRRKPANA
ncbi:hypothetical protein WG954_07445 [Lacibacter sp. H375]|uniref:hypothetical protein n=1 Tax=Lacibacter sp. H375 TaxID=3133424 RepID=UPI0030C0C846